MIVDEVDDTRTTLQYCVEELIKTNAPAAVATLVVHNKLKKKEGVMPQGVTYISGEDVPDAWNCYPWDAAAYGNTIRQHEEIAKKCAGEQQSAADSGSGSTRVSIAAAVGIGSAVALAVLFLGGSSVLKK